MERDKIIVFDEADSLLKNPEINMMLKPILDTSGSNVAEYVGGGTFNTTGMSKQDLERVSSQTMEDIQTAEDPQRVKIPSRFPFEGGMVFISNMPSSKIDQAIMSRSIFVDVHLAEQDVLKRIKSIGYAQADSGGVSKSDVDEVLEALGQTANAPEHEITYMTPEYARQSKQVTVRAMSLALTMKKAGLKRWSELAALYA